jgi:endoglycosylceramidase
MLRSALRLAAAALIAAAAAVPAAASAVTPALPHLGRGFLHVGPTGGPSALPQIVDASGRSVLLRGVNVAGLGDYWRADLRRSYPVDTAAYAYGACPPSDTSIEPPSVCASDLPHIARLGFNSVRLTLSWSLLEPRPGVVDPAYLRRIDQVVGWARDAHLWLVLDIHQDGWSKYAYTRGSCPPGLDSTPGFDGAPLWATDTTLPFCTVQSTRELDPGVALNFQRLWSDVPGPDGIGLQEHLCHVMAVLAGRYAHNDTVLGYDLLNEPSPGTALPPAAELQINRYYAKVIAAMRAAAPGFRQLVFVEPDVARATVTPAPTESLPFSAFSDYPNAVFAPHVYTGVFTADAMAGSPDTVQTTSSDWDAAVADARRLGLPMWVGEFGNGPDQDATLLMPAYAQMNARGIGGAMWIWRENHNDTNPAQTWSIAGTHREVTTARGYPYALSGDLLSLADDPTAHTFSLTYAAGRGTTLVFLPPAESGPLRVTGARASVRQVGAARLVSLRSLGGRVWMSVR